MNKQIINNALKHLRNDKKINKLIQQFPIPEFGESSDYFTALSKSIIYQQLNGKAAQTIYNRYLKLFKNNKPNPADVINIDVSDIKSVGISRQKSNYIIGLSEYFYNTGTQINFDNLTDTEVSKELIKLKGIGQWTIDMFLIFTLHRPDILPVGDLAIQKAFKNIFNMKDLPTTKNMIQKSEKWKPYRTFASWYLWRMIENDNNL